MTKNITIGIPCYNEELNVPRVYEVLTDLLSKTKYKYELLFVNNGSTDKTLEEIRKIAKKDKKVKCVSLSRNFGPESSMAAVIDYSTGDALVLYDCDMQDPPSLILRMLEKWDEGWEVVVGKYTNTEDPLLMKIARSSFYKLFKLVANIDVPVNSSTFSLLDKKVVDNIKSMPEKYRFYRGLRAWVGFKTTFVTYKRRKRKHGTSSSNFFGYIKYAERSFFGFSYVPLDIIVYLSIILVILSFIFIALYVPFSILFGNPINGSVAIFATIIFFGGVQLFAVSIIGKYIQVIVEEVKSRPVYMVDTIIN